MYDSNAQTISNALTSTSSTVFTQDTINDILALVTSPTNTTVVVDTVAPAANGTVTVAAGTEVVFVTTSNTVLTNVAIPGDIPAVFFQGFGVNATMAARTRQPRRVRRQPLLPMM